MGYSEKQFRFDGADGAPIAGFRWADEAAAPRAVLQIAHGMGEHARRYPEPLIPIMADGFVLYADDHRGHGYTAPSKAALGDFGENGAELVVEDIARLTDLARAENPGLPLILLGHSLGSFFSQAYAFDHAGKLDGLVLSGTAAFGDRTGPAKKLDEMNADGAKPRTPYDWLSRDDAEVDKYIADPLCGFSRQPSAADSFARVGARLRDPAEIAKIPKDLPLYIFVGDKDPINRDLELLHPLVNRYRDAGLTRMEVKVYEGGRHEMLNETNRDEVVADLLAWLRKTVG
ncbi:alpha/beta hydrolase [Phenylobacterium sp.]|uniref:alpha/beta hydrolase n=1 Tax=Phenylobacterium sp. TaxID=1871053 RepID=UPI00286DFDB2|nr:alpha/beta hydrolase [Phenylobacterium sp.]